MKVKRFILRLPSLLMPVEWVLFAFGVLVLGLYNYFDLPMPGQPGGSAQAGPFLFYLKQFLTCLDLYAIVVLAYVAARIIVFARAHREALKDAPWRTFWLRLLKRFYLEELFQDIRFFHAVLLMFVEFALLKNLIPLVNPHVYDEFFIWSDKIICGGEICSVFLQKILGTDSLAAVSAHYRWYYPYMSIVAFLFIAAANRRLAQEYLCAFVLLFLVGVVWIYAIPTWGPVYARPELFEFMKGSDIWGLQMSLWSMKEQLAQDPKNREAIFMISGFPSLHVAVVLLGSIYLKRLNRYFSLISWSFFLLIINSTIYLGWHYLLDDVGAVALVAVCMFMAKRFTWWWRLSDDESWCEPLS